MERVRSVWEGRLRELREGRRRRERARARVPTVPAVCSLEERRLRQCFLSSSLVPCAPCRYMDVFPRLGPGGLAGFEFGSGMHSNSSMPEHDAAVLRDIVPKPPNLSLN